MTQVLDKASLKSKFADGKKPTGEDFSDLIDTIAAGTPTATTVTTASKSAAIAGTDNTRPVTPAGVKAHVDERLANEGQATGGGRAPKGTNRWLMTPERTKQAIAAQVPAFITAAKAAILGGVSASYDTLQKLFNYITNSFYNRTQSDARYDQKTDTLAASRLTGTLDEARIPNLSPSKLKANNLDGTELNTSLNATDTFRVFVKRETQGGDINYEWIKVGADDLGITLPRPLGG